jgi:hypothetical protein
MEYISNPWVISWIVLGVCILVLAVYRKLLANREDDIVHVTSGESKVFSKQLNIAQRLQKIDFWGKTLTIVLAVYGLALVGLLVYRQYNGYYAPQ